jgi:hypothetical protein
VSSGACGLVVSKNRGPTEPVDGQAEGRKVVRMPFAPLRFEVVACQQNHPNSASAVSILASIGVGPNCEKIRIASVRCFSARTGFFLAL